jgi:hypothetical protein
MNGQSRFRVQATKSGEESDILQPVSSIVIVFGTTIMSSMKKNIRHDSESDGKHHPARNKERLSGMSADRVTTREFYNVESEQ